MENVKLSAYQSKPRGRGGRSSLEQTTIYNIQGKTFIVEPVFKKEGRDTVGTILLRLIQSDSENA